MAKHILVTGATNIGKAGVATIVYKWGQQFNSEKIVYDYLMQKGLPEMQYQKAIASKGGKIYTMKKKPTIIGIINWVEYVIKEYSYETIHINSDSSYIAAAYIYAAKRGGIKNIYVHSHCTQIDDVNKLKRIAKTILHKICKPYVCRNTNMYLACSKHAGIWMFGKNNVKSKQYKTIYNGVEVDQYLYDSDAREYYRNKLGYNNKFVIANIGRLSYQKNQEFLIKVFAQYHKKNVNSILVIVGEGELKKELISLVDKLMISKYVYFLGLRDDVNKLLSAFDVLVMPSRFEGLPVTMVEAQMANLPCVVSGAITREAKFTNDVIYVDDWDLKSWSDAIDNMVNIQRSNNNEYLTESIFNTKKSVIELQEILLKGNC